MSSQHTFGKARQSLSFHAFDPTYCQFVGWHSVRSVSIQARESSWLESEGLAAVELFLQYYDVAKILKTAVSWVVLSSIDSMLVSYFSPCDGET